MNLYELNQEYRKAFDAITVDEETGEIIGEEALDAITGDLRQKWEAYGIVVKELEADAAALKEEADRLYYRMKVAKKKADYLKNTLSASMQLAGDTELKTSRVAVTFRKSVSVNIIDEDLLPKRFLRRKQIIEPDKTAIADVLKSGLKVKGAELVTNQKIQIK